MSRNVLVAIESTEICSKRGGSENEVLFFREPHDDDLIKMFGFSLTILQI